MIFLPFTIGLILLLIVLIPAFLILLNLGILTVAFRNLGISVEAALLYYLLSLATSSINIPIYSRTVPTPQYIEDSFFDLFLGSVPQVYKEQIIALNVGGGLIPTILALFFSLKTPILPFLITLAAVTFVSYVAARPVPGVGIMMPIWISPLTSALAASIIAPEGAAALVAFSAGILGTLLGADLLHLKDFMKEVPGVLSIGGAGVYDGIFLTGIIAAFLS
jgi:uncharacterized membrane protein